MCGLKISLTRCGGHADFQERRVDDLRVPRAMVGGFVVGKLYDFQEDHPLQHKHPCPPTLSSSVALVTVKMPPVCKKSRGFLSVKKKRKKRGKPGPRSAPLRSITEKGEIVTRYTRKINDTIRPPHNDHSYCNNGCGEEGSRLTEKNLDDSFNHREMSNTDKGEIVTTRKINDTIRPPHNDHSYCKGEEGSRLTETTLADSFNHREIAGTSTPYPAPVRRRLHMEVSSCNQHDTHEDSVEELIPLEDMEVSNCSRDANELIVEGPIPLETNVCNDTPVPICVSGRRIVDFASLYNQIKQIDNHNKVMGCSINNCNIIKEQCYGLRSKFNLKCNMCNMAFILSTDDDRSSTMDVNTASVAGAMCIGIGHSQLQELLSSMEIPGMSAVTYSVYHDKLTTGWEETALDEMKSAATDEIAHAISEGHVTSDGTPILTVVADGSWAKRSYRTNYNSLSGVAAIVGFHTKKVIFLGVRNKYCTVCSRAATTSNPPSEHSCFKNWNGTSSGMETDIILEGFSRSMEMYGAMYGKILADGDSSVYATLYEARPYPHLTIEKIECTNHLLRNFCNKLKEVANKTSLGPKALRNVLLRNVLRLRTAVSKAVEYRGKNDHDVIVQVSGLISDIINSPSHVFGEHLKCQEIGYFCDGSKENEKNYVPELKEAGIYTEIMKIVGSLADHARSLLVQMNNNPAEHYNSIVAKFIGGKRVNFALKNSYKARCFAAVVSHNSQLPLYKLHKSMYNRSPGQFLKCQQIKRKRKNEQRALRRASSRNKRRKMELRAGNNSDGAKHYGEAAMKPDMPEDIFQIKKDIFLNTIQSEEELVKLERGTLLQAGSGLWKEERRKLLTASNFGTVCKRRKTTSCEGLVKSLLYRDLQTPAMLYGKENEGKAIGEFEEKTGLRVDKCGLFVDRVTPYLGATPDGLIGDNGIIEIKCPASCSHLTPEEGIMSRKFTFWEANRNKTKVEGINKNQNYFYQVQGQLHVTRRKYCHFVMWTPQGMRIEVIERDDEFWNNYMEEKLRNFYMDCLLPELVDPRQTRSMPIRNPLYIIAAIEQAKEQRKKSGSTEKT